MRGLPAIAILSPEMKEASLLARKATALETSSGSPNLVTPFLGKMTINVRKQFVKHNPN